MSKIVIANRKFSTKNVNLFIQGVLIVLASILILFDVIWGSDGIGGNTISEIVQEFTNDSFFILIYLWGALAAHFFIPKRRIISLTLNDKLFGFLTVLLLGVVIGLVCGNYLESQDNTPFIELRTLVGSAGFVFGYIFWAQSFRNTPLA